MNFILNKHYFFPKIIKNVCQKTSLCEHNYSNFQKIYNELETIVTDLDGKELYIIKKCFFFLTCRSEGVFSYFVYCLTSC